MCDFHDFGLTFFLHYVYSGSCTITSKAKINIFWKIFFTPLAPSGPLHSKKFKKTLILAFEANSVHCPAKMHFFLRFIAHSRSHLSHYICLVNQHEMALNQNKTRNYSYVSGVLGETTQHHQVKDSIFIFKNYSNINFP